MPFQCESHTVQLVDRGGKNTIGEFPFLTDIDWARIRDDYTESTIHIEKPTIDCLELLNMAHPNRHELVIWRGDDRVWEGPITRIKQRGTNFEIAARDIVHYLYRTAMWNDYDSSAGEAVVDRTERIITGELSRVKENAAIMDPVVNVLPFLTSVRYSDPALERRTTRKTLAFSGTVYDDIDSLAADWGLDYTAIGRRLILHDTRVPIGYTPTVTEDDFIGDVSVTAYGMESFTRAITVGDQGMYGLAGGIHPYYGEWEYVAQMFDEDSEEAPSQNSLDNAAAYNMTDRIPVPVVINVPESSRLNPRGVLRIQDLIPGVHVPVRAEFQGKKITQMQKLDSVKVSESENEGEVIQVSIGPAPSEIGSSPW